MNLIINLTIQTFILSNVVCYSDYFSRRELLKRTESYSALGGNTVLTEKEIKINNCLMRHKILELEYAFDNPQYFNMSQHYFLYKDKMKESKVYKIIQRMPKGAALHVHDIAFVGADYIMNLTYLENLYVCFDKDDLHLRFTDRKPTQECENWKLMSEARRSSQDVKKFDAELRKHFTMVVDNPDEVYKSITDTWAKLSKYFKTVRPLLNYRPIWEQLLFDAFKEFLKDNVMYIEIRTGMPQLYELNGTLNSRRFTVECYKKAIQRFVIDYPDFFGVKIIFASSRRVDRNGIEDAITVSRQIKEAMPEFFAGFDLVGQEDLGMPLFEFAPQLLEAKDLTYFFHAGETDWYGTLTDENLLDAILLGAKRIGHGYALAKHPMLMKEVKERNIAIEVNVISNEVLSLVRDMRNHPLSIFLANGLPVVLSSDDPGVWDAEPLTDDFYVAFLGASSRYSDLRLLKTLAVNSLKYSALDTVSKERALTAFSIKWDNFVDEFDCSAY